MKQNKRSRLAFATTLLFVFFMQTKTKNVQVAANDYKKAHRELSKAINQNLKATKAVEDVGFIPEKQESALVQHLTAKETLQSAHDQMQATVNAVQNTENIPQAAQIEQNTAKGYVQQADILHTSAAQKMHSLMQNTDMDSQSTTSSLQQIVMQHKLAAENLLMAAVAQINSAKIIQEAALAKRFGTPIMHQIVQFQQKTAESIKTAEIAQHNAAYAVSKIIKAPQQIETAKVELQTANNTLEQAIAQHKKAHTALSASLYA